MITSLTGWLTVLGLIATSALLVLNTVNPTQGEGRINIHCAMGKMLVVTTIAHVLSVPFNGFNGFAIWSAMGLIFITIGTGVILSYLPGAGKIRYHARSIHPALMIAVFAAVAHHVMTAMGFL